jgi:hypothetical protein
MADPSYKELVDALTPILGGAPSLTHTDLVTVKGDSSKTAPCTELATFFTKSENASELEKIWTDFITKNTTKGNTGIDQGWVIEEQEHKGEKVKAFKILIGWGSVEDHMAFRETDEFKTFMPQLRALLVGSDMFHVYLKQSQ